MRRCVSQVGRVTRQLGSELSRGQSLVEFAIALPVLAMLSFGAIDLGRAFVVQVSLVNAAREGARYCASHVTETGATLGTLTRVQAELGPHTSMLDTTTVTCSAVTLADGSATVTVAPEALFSPITPYAGVVAGGTIRLRATSTMLRQ